MTYSTSAEKYNEVIESIKDDGLYKDELLISSQQSADIKASEPGGQPREVINFCANNYLGLANHPDLIDAGKKTLDQYGYGMSSVRFICGTLDIHKQLEKKVADFLGMEDTILYSSCFDANGGLFETLLDDNDAVISDALNHASIIDGIRLCKAERRRFAHNDMADLEKHLKETQNKKVRLVATDGVFSMDGDIARLQEITDLAEKYDALVMVDDSHATGFMGENGKGSYEYCKVEGKIDIITSTLGKALGGASGGFTSGRAKIIELLRQRSRPYLFSNTVAPVVIGASLRVLDLLTESSSLRDKLHENTRYFREQMTSAGFDIRDGVHPIVPIMLGEARLAKNMASDMFAEGIYVIGFSFPVVPRGQARIRVQLSAAHEKNHLDQAVEAFIKIGRKYDILGKKMEEIIEMYADK
ncbi:MAG: glycine C-acetyltransferase [candidate division Zixibacteria bacterium]|nr:glycine C-acetyltransferase [candidate division Zixibacteria bacterium]